MSDIGHYVGKNLRRIANVYLRMKWRRQLRCHGLSILSDITHSLEKADIPVFADFGTLLGIVREGRLLAHDMDLDFGILPTTGETAERVSSTLKSIGCLHWRDYSVAGRIAMQSYLYPVGNTGERLKFDINYYELTPENSRTWLFYRDPALRYAATELSVVELNYAPIIGIEHIEIQGVRVAIPKNAEHLLEQKYGPTWRVPDMKWLYWTSPAARPLNQRESYIQHIRR